MLAPEDEKTEPAALRLDALPEFLTAEEVASLLRLPPSTTYEYLKRGFLPSIKIGRSKRIPRDQFLAKLDELIAGVDRNASE